MKSKKMFLSLVAIIFSIFIGYNIYSVENSQQTFDVSFLNIEALASGESSGNCPEYGSGCLDVSIRPLVYFSSSCYKIKSQTKYVRLLTLL